MDVQWVRIASWHALRPHDHFGPSTYCGRYPGDKAERRDELPAEKSCESCLRTVARLRDAGAD